MTGRMRRIAAVGLAIVGVSLLVSAARAEADTAASGLAPIIDASTYPATLPSGCPEGAGSLWGVRYENGRGGVEADFSRLNVGAGDTVTLRWDGFAPGCVDGAGLPTVAITLAAYLTPTAQFDPGVDQELAAWTSCGLGAAACANDAGGYSLRLPVPAETVGCRFQIDAILGAPLAVVGPGGSYYGSVLRGSGPSMLIGAATVDIPNCVPAVAPTTTATSAAPPPVAPPPVAPPPAGPTTTVTTTAVAPPVPPSTAATTTTARAAVQGIAVTRQTLPATGSATARATGVGTGLVFAGLGALALSALLSSRNRPMVPLVALVRNRPNAR